MIAVIGCNKKRYALVNTRVHTRGNLNLTVPCAVSFSCPDINRAVIIGIKCAAQPADNGPPLGVKFDGWMPGFEIGAIGNIVVYLDGA